MTLILKRRFITVMGATCDHRNTIYERHTCPISGGTHSDVYLPIITNPLLSQDPTMESTRLWVSSARHWRVLISTETGKDVSVNCLVFFSTFFIITNFLLMIYEIFSKECFKKRSKEERRKRDVKKVQRKVFFVRQPLAKLTIVCFQT